MKKNTMCQSCGMPLKKDANGGGTNADGSKSLLYCSHCYQNDKFTMDCTAEEMRMFVVNKLVEMKFPRFLAKFFAHNIPRLQRWKN